MPAMNKPKHTPGPWEFGFSHWGRWQIDSAKDTSGLSFHIGELAAYSGLGGIEVRLNEQQKANARLIAAAPDMLAALKTIAANTGELTGKEIEMVYAAIAKATGEP